MIDRLIDSISPRSCGYMDTICVRRAVLFGGHKLERMLGESHSLTLFLVRHSLVPACAMQPSTCHSSTFCDEDAFAPLTCARLRVQRTMAGNTSSGTGTAAMAVMSCKCCKLTNKDRCASTYRACGVAWRRLVVFARYSSACMYALT